VTERAEEQTTQLFALSAIETSICSTVYQASSTFAYIYRRGAVLTEKKTVMGQKKIKQNAQPALQIKTFVETTSAHGFMYIAANFGWLAKSIWILLTIAGTKDKILF